MDTNIPEERNKAASKQKSPDDDNKGDAVVCLVLSTAGSAMCLQPMP